MAEKIKSIDAHIHYSLKYPSDELIRTMDSTDTGIANLVLVPSRTSLSSVPDALMVKDMYPGRFYVFASLDVSVYYRFAGKVGIKMRDYARQMLRCGCDGIKIIEGKPNMRKMLPVPDWDSEQWDPFFKWAEKKKIPILWHVNDPETFWDYDTAPKFAKDSGWVYDSSFINNEAQYTQVLNLLKKHPKLRIIFAHFFFMSNQLDRLSSILDSYPNVMVDLTPGIEMYENFSSHIDETRKFFARYSGRIVYGTDIGARGVLSDSPVSYEESLSRASVVRTFLESSGSVEVPGDGIFLAPDNGFEMKCLGLDYTSLSNILRNNFLRFVGRPCAEVNGRLVLKDIRRIRITLIIMSFIDKELKKDTTCLDQVKTYFTKEKKISEKA